MRRTPHGDAKSINGVPVWGGSDTTFTAGRVGVGMYAGGGSSGNGLWLDHAKLTVLGAGGGSGSGQSSGADGAANSADDPSNTLTESIEGSIDASQAALNKRLPRVAPSAPSMMLRRSPTTTSRSPRPRPSEVPISHNQLER